MLYIVARGVIALLQALPLAYFGWLVGILLGYGVLTTVMKRFYVRWFGWQ